MKLPKAFIAEMDKLFEKLPGVSPSERTAFFASFQEERSYGLRRNPLKYTKEEFENNMPFSLQSVPWAEEGYFYEENSQPGKKPYHEAGAYYIQEPSAMIAVELLKVRPGDKVADLCAAPGGKSTQIAGKMQGKGLLVCNEYVPSRAGILAQNMERMGVANCIILKEDTRKIAERFPLFFDKVLVDAPCSGEGMFRKEEQALLQWSPENVEMCSLRQQEIIENAAAMLRPGGMLVYSTCTFSEAENEEVIRHFLERHLEFRADEKVPTAEMLSCGICAGGVAGSVRMWPHKLRGEGHFAACLIKDGKETEEKAADEKDGKETEIKAFVEKDRKEADEIVSDKRYRKEQVSKLKKTESEREKLFRDFCTAYIEPEYLIKLERTGLPVWTGDRLFYCPNLPLQGLSTERSGLYLGEAKKGRFEPSHSWAMTLQKEDVRQWKEAENPAAYLRGEAEMQNPFGQKGWLLMLFDNRPLGWGKAGGNMIKNHYPKGLRKNVL